jgi:hypothetical protein
MNELTGYITRKYTIRQINLNFSFRLIKQFSCLKRLELASYDELGMYAN